MNLRELEKSTEELILKNRYNEDNINLKKERLSTIKENGLGTKCAITASISMIIYAALLIIIVLNGVSILPSFIPVNLISPIIALTSIVSGVVGERILGKLKIGNKITSNDSIKELEEQIKLEIELEQSKNKELAVQNSVDMLNTNENIIKSISDDANVINSTLKDESINDLNLNLEEQYKRLDELTIKKVLSDKFWLYNNKTKPLFKVLSAFLITSLSSMLVFGIPNVVLSDLLTYSDMYSALLGMTTPFVIGGITGGLYTIKNNKDNKKVFNKLKEEFNVDDLDSKLIEKEIKGTIKNISDIEIKIQDMKRINEKTSYLKEEKEKNDKNIILNNEMQHEIVEENNLEIKGPVRKIGQKK